ncbi:CLUMA_CG009492, isoform A [Clunio marinus]|uniref:CLUMA_CG009492, isoform A n=1 Tax=Clunio marinus TaxID=568069 RepID=A0A1J1I6X3_9DIPT|nr:CLUMA_CG009492, isoform A [Clunio marinus]
MKWLLSFLVLGFNLLSFAQHITLEIPQHHVNEATESEESSFTTYITKKYFFVTFFKANFFRAHQYCQLNNMELLTIDSKEEESVFMNLINAKDFEFKTAKDFWTSGNDLGEEGKFYFLTNGKSVGKLNWAKNEPNNGRRADSNETENCMGYTMTENLKFYRLFDRFCSIKSNFICQSIE